MPSDSEWSRAYATQALSDLRTYDLLADGEADDCQLLHYLQMASEKVCKAFLSIEYGHATVGFSHVVIAKALPLLARRYFLGRFSKDAVRTQLPKLRSLAVEIESLHQPFVEKEAGLIIANILGRTSPEKSLYRVSTGLKTCV
ncbi:MAG: hypothetical protein JSS87_03590 [Acidobacteria bacterium]|nr:hypothetical protein [Acidobacteriota bacterium]